MRGGIRTKVDKTITAGIAYRRCAALKDSIDGSKYKTVFGSRVTLNGVVRCVMLEMAI